MKTITYSLLLTFGGSLAASGQTSPAEMVQQSLQLLDQLEQHQNAIEQKSVTEKTRARQAEILELWDAILDAAGEQSPPQSPPEQPPMPQDQSGSPEEKLQPGETSPMPQGQKPDDKESKQPAENQQGKQPGESATDEPADRSSTQTRQQAREQAAQLRAEEKQKLMREVWGKLPPRLRDKLLNASDEEILPQYEDQIRTYFRKLSAAPRQR